MKKPKLAIWGASGHARVVADVVRAAGEYEVAGFLDDRSAPPTKTTFCGAPLLGGREQLPRLQSSGIEQLIVAVGDCRQRTDLAEVARQHGLKLACVVHPRAVVADDVELSPGSVVMATAVLNAAVRLGENVIVNTAASVDHECVLEDGVHVCPGVRLAGNVHVARAAWLGIGSVVIQGVRIGAGAQIGAGAVVLNDISDGAVAYGVPAREAPRRQQVA